MCSNLKRQCVGSVSMPALPAAVEHVHDDLVFEQASLSVLVSFTCALALGEKSLI